MGVSTSILIAQQAQSQVHFFVLMAGMLVVLYMLIWRPQRKKEQQRRQMISNVRKGDHVVTIGGIHGEIVNLREDSLVLLVDRERGATLKITRSALHRIVSESDDDNFKE